MKHPTGTWRNWAGTVQCRPSRQIHPSSVTDVVDAVAQTRDRGGRIRALGAGHSFSDIAVTQDTRIVLDRMTGLVGADLSTGRATFGAGTSILAAAEALAGAGLAFSNLGDTGYQSLAGAAATGTHGSGLGFGSISSYVTGVELVTGTGEVLAIDESEPDLLAAARVSLGALGIATSVTMQCEDAFTLETTRSVMDAEECLAELDSLLADNEHFELWWFPYTGKALTTARNRTNRPADPSKPAVEWFTDVFMGNHVFGLVLGAGRNWPRTIPSINRLAAALSPQDTRVARSDRGFLSDRRTKLQEMEYNVPREEAVPLLRRFVRDVEDLNLPVSFPVHARFGPAESSLLSPAFGRDGATIGCMVDPGLPYVQPFQILERMATAVGGRPHWGKEHYRTAEELRADYPRWDDFQAIRRHLDPDGVFGNEYTDRVLGPVG